MARPRFSEMLLARRRELGLSVSQASSILKLREDVLVAFEEGDWERMPQSGYAQGMLSSYARYLGLNAREVVDLFQEELYEHRNGTSSHELRRRTRDTQMGRGIAGYDVVNEAGSRPKAYVEYRPLLPTGGGPAGDMGNFSTTTPVRPRGSVPLAGTGTPAPGTRGAYGSYQGSSYGSGSEAQQRRPYNAPARQERAQPSTARRRSAPARSSRRRSDDPASRLISEERYAPGRAQGGEWRRDDVSTRRVRPSEYTDDLRLDDHASSFAPASTVSGRRSSRNIAPVERPNVRRRSGTQGRSGSGRSRRPPSRGGLVGAVEEFFSDPRRTLFVLIVLLVAALTAILVFSVSSCTGSRGERGQGGQTVTVNSAGADEGSGSGDGADSGSDAGTDGSSDAGTDGTDGSADTGDDAADAGDAGADGTAGAATDEPREVVVEVSVASGQSSWLEITSDGGTSEVADTIIGPWSATYTVNESLSVEAANPDAVTVTMNGEKLDFTSKVGGMGQVTVKGPDKTAADAGTSGDGGDASPSSNTTTGAGN